MQVFRTEVQRDHLERLLRVRPAVALSEIVWNALDADARNVDVEFEADFSNGLTAILVRDDGSGISELDAATGFRKLGGSWKLHGGLTHEDKRVLHGKSGEGRFAAFALGSDISWRSTSQRAGHFETLTIESTIDRLGEFRLSDVEVAENGVRGTLVRIANVAENANVVRQPAAVDELVEHFALYLRQYPYISVRVDGVRLDPQSLTSSETVYALPVIVVNGREVSDLELRVVEWRAPTTRSLYLCSPEGITRHSLGVPMIRAPGFEFTAYLRSAYVQELYDSNDLFIGHTHAGVDAIYNAAVDQLREHFRRRGNERASETVAEWKRSGIYPYDGEGSTTVEQSERKVFDVMAVQVNALLPDFSSSDTKVKKLSLQLLRAAIESNPESMQRILTDVLGLPKNRQDELAELLQRTSLSSIISATKLVADRLDFLRALECLVFERQPKKELLERRQLHRILADHTWIFGEEFNLSVDDESLSAVLDKHVQLIGRKQRNPTPVLGIDGGRKIVDLMLSRSIPQARAVARQHLIVELKRPSQKIDEKVHGQITKYALAVAKDEQFRDTETSWSFWAVSNERDEFVDFQASQSYRPLGLIGADEQRRITIWAKTWGEIIQDCKAKLELFRRHLNYAASREGALASLRKTHEKYFPPSLAGSASADNPADETLVSQG